MRISPGTRQLQHAALRSLQLSMILLDQPSQPCRAHRRQLHPRIEHTFTLDLPADTLGPPPTRRSSEIHRPLDRAAQDQQLFVAANTALMIAGPLLLPFRT